jgi:adenylate cyclase
MLNRFTSLLLSYVPMDRRQALAENRTLPPRSAGAVLFADISGFTSLADTLTRSLGPHLGAEELIGALNRVYESLVSEVDHHGGSVISFAGDGLTAWFDQNPLTGLSGTMMPAGGITGVDLEAATLRAVGCGMAMQNAMRSFHTLWIAGGRTAAMGLKVTVAAGGSRRFLVGDSAIQVIEMLAGAPLTRVGAAARVARDGEILLDALAAASLEKQAVMGERRFQAIIEEWFYPVACLLNPVEPSPWPPLSADALSSEQLRPWVLPEIAQRVESNHAGFLTELRFTVSLFLRFADLDYELDAKADAMLNAFVRWVQGTLKRFEGYLLGVTVGDKGSYLYATFGAPIAHGDDSARAVAAALELVSPPRELSFAGRPRIGIAGGQSRTGNVGGSTRAYGVMGDATNLAAHLMEAAHEGQILVSATLAPAVNRRFLLKPVTPIPMKGKTGGAPAAIVLRRRPATSVRREEPEASFSFVGRREELAAVEQHLAEALRGEGRIVGIAGNAGIGKSRFASEVMQRATEEGFECLVGEAQSTETQTPYLAWQSVFRVFFGIDGRTHMQDRVPALERALTALDPTLVSRLPLLGAPLALNLSDNPLTRELTAHLRKESLEDLIVQCLHRRAQRVPLLLLIEDVHWLDPLSLELVNAVSRAAATMPLVFLLTYRPTDTVLPASSLVPNLPDANRIQLLEFSEAEAAQLIRERLQLGFGPQADISLDFVDSVIARAGGNPFYLEEVINYLQHRGISPAETKTFERLELPASLASLILARIDGLTPQQQMTLKVASVIGREFRGDWLQAAYQGIGTEEQVNQHLEILAQLDLTPLNAEQPYRTYTFKHATIQEVAYQSIPFALRSQLHEEFAAWLEKSKEACSVDLLAYHYGKGRNCAKKRDYFEKAGRAAAGRYANTAAIQYYDRLLELLEPDEEPPVLIALAEVLVRTGDWKTAEAHFLRAIDLASRLQDRRLRAQAQLGFGKLQRAQGDETAAAATLENAHADFVALGDFAGSFDCSTELAFVSGLHGDAHKARELMEESLRTAEQAGDRQRIAHALFVTGTIAFMLGMITEGKGDITAARPWWLRSLKRQEELGNKVAVAQLSSNLGVAALEEGQIEQAEVLVRRAIMLFHEIGFRWQYSHAHITLALILMDKGDLRGARSAATACLALSSELGALQEIGDALIVMALIAHRGGPSPAVSRYVLHVYGSACKLKDKGGDKLFILRRRIEKTLAEARQGLREEEANASLAAGETMGWQEAVEYAVNFGGHSR